ncbi:MAG: efflux RND transporter permease subunit [Candidatus Ratteibacteria bacterium]|nr:efflux RND transporter permease subunit [Candidatus Ratteibacteria bacterium]
MTLSEFSVKKPVTISMVFLGIILIGIIAWTRLPRELFPPIVFPQLSIVTRYENAAPQEIETLITKPIEEVVGTVPNLRRISSTSKEGISLVIADFNWGTNMDFASLSVREKIDLIKERLPRESEDSVVVKYNPLELPMMVLSVTGEEFSLYGLKEICRREIKEKLEKIEGVASVILTGGEEREILVEIDQGRLQASGISLLSIVQSLKESNLNFPAGTIEAEFFEFLVRTMGEFKSIDEIENTAILAVDDKEKDWFHPGEKDKEEERRLIYLRDIAKVKDTFKEKTSVSRYNKLDNISVSIRKQADANTLQVAARVSRVIKQLKPDLPEGLRINVVYDQSNFVKRSLKEVSNAALIGMALAFLVLLFFLKNFRSAVIITFSIPLSILAALIMMFFANMFFKMSLNMMSLGGLALGVGMLVDNSVVVIENIFRHRQMGETPEKSAIRGSNEVYNAVVASTLTTISVFFPFVFISGVAGQLFKQLAFTVIFSLIASLFVAVTLIPLFFRKIALNAQTTRKKSVPPLDSSFVESGKVTGFFNLITKRTIPVILLVSFSLFIVSLGVIFRLDKEFMPKMDQRQFIVKLDKPMGTKLKVTTRAAERLENILFEIPEVKEMTLNIGSSKEATPEESIETLGSHQAQFMVNLFSRKEQQMKSRASGAPKGMALPTRIRSTAEILQELKKRIQEAKFPGSKFEYLLQESVFGSSFLTTAPVAVSVKGYDLAVLKKLSGEVKRQLAKIKGLYGIKDTMAEPTLETRVKVDKDRAVLYHLSVNDISQVTRVAIKGDVATKFKELGEEYDVRVRLRPQDRAGISDLRNIFIYTPRGEPVYLDQVASLKMDLGPSEIKRQEQERIVQVTANVYRRRLTDIFSEVKEIIENLTVLQDYTVKLAGESEEMQSAFSNIRFALILAILLVYMIMASLFESLIQPFVIMFTIPMAIIGVAAALFLTNTPLSAVAFLGIIMLGGIVVNNGIILIDFVNRLRQQGLGIRDAAIKAAKIRVRPILMTSFTTILGLLPLALGMSEGKELRAPLAITVIGGLTAATFLTLIVIPSVYIVIESFLEKFRK